MASEYKIKTIQDFITVVNRDNLDNLVTDFKNFLGLSLVYRELKKEIEIPDVTIELKEDVFNWIDDGKNEVTMNIETKIKTKENK